MDALEELITHLTGPSRAIVISEKEVDLRSQSEENRLFLLKIGEGSLAAGGRGGGFGERKVTAVFFFEKKKGEWAKSYESQGETEAAEFEVPYYVSRLPMTLADGGETMGYGVIDPELLAKMMNKAGIGSSA